MQMIKQLDDKSLSCCELGNLVLREYRSRYRTRRFPDVHFDEPNCDHVPAMNGVNMIRLRGRFFAVNVSSSSSADVRSALDAVVPKRDSVMYTWLYKLMMKLMHYKSFFRNLTGMLGRNAECYADAVLPTLR
jgi:hypothetical protein